MFKQLCQVINWPSELCPFEYCFWIQIYAYILMRAVSLPHLGTLGWSRALRVRSQGYAPNRQAWQAHASAGKWLAWQKKMRLGDEAASLVKDAGCFCNPLRFHMPRIRTPGSWIQCFGKKNCKPSRTVPWWQSECKSEECIQSWQYRSWVVFGLKMKTTVDFSAMCVVTAPQKPQHHTGWWFGTWLLFSPIVGMMIQSDELIFFRGVGIPPISIYHTFLVGWRWFLGNLSGARTGVVKLDTDQSGAATIMTNRRPPIKREVQRSKYLGNSLADNMMIYLFFILLV